MCASNKRPRTVRKKLNICEILQIPSSSHPLSWKTAIYAPFENPSLVFLYIENSAGCRQVTAMAHAARGLLVMNHWILRLLPVLILTGTSAAYGDSIVIPAAREASEGGTYTPFPFSPASYGIQTQRHQQIYAASAFGANPGPQLITEIRFRPDSGAGKAFTATLPDVRIDLSTTPIDIGQLSRGFDENLGAECVTVFEGPLTISSSKTGPAFGPRDFDIVIPLATPFLYDPAQGNLLMDLRNYGGPLTTYFDADNDRYQETERCYSTRTGVDSPVADFVDPIVLVTQFITVATAPPVIDVLVDVKPGSDANSLNLKSNGKSKGKSAAAGGVLPVAVLTTDEFDSALVDVGTVKLGDPLLSGTAGPIRTNLEDVDDDGDLDLLLHFSMLDLVEAGAVAPDSETLFLSGMTTDGYGISGFDGVTIVP